MSAFLIWRRGRRPWLGVSAIRAVGCAFMLLAMGIAVGAVVWWALTVPLPADFLSGAALLAP